MTAGIYKVMLVNASWSCAGIFHVSQQVSCIYTASTRVHERDTLSSVHLRFR
jgi:hypothetical protein